MSTANGKPTHWPMFRLNLIAAAIIVVVIAVNMLWRASHSVIRVITDPQARVKVTYYISDFEQDIPISRDDNTFKTGDLEPGTYAVAIAAEGFMPQRSKVEVGAGQEVQLAVVLEPVQTISSDRARKAAETYIHDMNVEAKNPLQPVEWKLGDVEDIDADGVYEAVVNFWQGGNTSSDALWQIVGDSMQYLDISNQLGVVGSSYKLASGKVMVNSPLRLDSDPWCCPSYTIVQSYSYKNGQIALMATDTVHAKQ